MMKLIKSKKGIAALLVTVVVVAVAAFGAYAYFTNTGTGDKATAVSVGNPSATGGYDVKFDFAADGTTAIPTTYVGGSALLPTAVNSANKVVATVPFTVVNTSEASTQVHTWTASLTGFTAGCSASDFSVGGEAVGVAHTVTGLTDDLAPNSDGRPSDAKTYSVTVQMINNTAADQSGCKTQTPTLHVVVG
jgi:hypothetical protein